MTANDKIKAKSLRVLLPEADKWRIKSLAAGEGLTLGEAIHQAFKAWEAQLQSCTPGRQPAPRAGETADAGRATRATQSQPKQTARSGRHAHADAAPSATAGGNQVRRQPEAARPWLRRAAQLEWSKCPLVESAPAKEGSIWVLRGTNVPLASLLTAVDEGHPLLEIAEAYEISMQFLLAVLQFVAKPAAPTG